MVQIHPSTFDKRSARAIEDLINEKYADKVIHKVGLCVCFHSIIATSEGLIGHGNGMVHVNVDFRLIIYRPFRGEILHATITHSSLKDGVYLSQDFFEDILVPPETLPENTVWKRDENGVEVFVWQAENDAEYYFDRAEPCLFRVEDEQWQDMSPETHNPGGKFIAEEGVDAGQVRKTPYLIRGSMMHSGLGPMLWWEEQAAEE